MFSLLVLAAPAAADPTVAYSTQWGGFGTTEGFFNYPGGIGTDSSGNVYVADTGNHRIQKFSSSGAFLTEWGSQGSGEGQFEGPNGIAVSAAGNVYVADTGNDRIQVFTVTGTYVGQWGGRGVGDGQLWFPADVAADTDGNVYVSDRGNARIQKFTSAGTFITKWGGLGQSHGRFSGIWGVAADPSGNVLVADRGNERVEGFTSAGTWFASLKNLHAPSGVDVGPSGNMFVSDTSLNRVEEFSPAGVSRGAVAIVGSGNGEVYYPTDIKTDSTGALYVVDTNHHRVQKFAPKGGLPPLDPPQPAPGTVAVDGDDTVSDADGCGGGAWRAADDCNTIQTGVNVVKLEGGRISVRDADAPYQESVVLNKYGLTIVGFADGGLGGVLPQGDLADYPTIAPTSGPAFNVTQTDVLVEGVVITGEPGVSTNRSRTTLRENVFKDNVGAAIAAVYGDGTVVTGNEFISTKGGLDLDGAIDARDTGDLQIMQNVFEEQVDTPAINIHGDSRRDPRVVIDSNVSFGNEGFVLSGVVQSDVVNNFMFGLNGEVKLEQDGSEVAGVLLDDVSDVVVFGNAIVESPIAIQLGKLATSAAAAPVQDVAIAGNELLGNGADVATPTGGIYVTGRAQLSGMSVFANRLSGNSSYANSGGVVTDPSVTAGIDARNNWWGCNEGPDGDDCDFVEDGVNFTPWTVLSLDAEPAQPPVPGTAGLQAHLLRNSFGQQVDEAILFPPVAIDLTQESGPGQLSESQVLTEEGTAGASLHSEQAGRAVVRADLDWESARATIDFGGSSVAQPGSGSGAGALGGKDSKPPTVSKAAASPATFAVDPRGVAELLVAAARFGTSFRYTLSEAASVTFTIERRLAGRKVGRKCRRVTTRNRKRVRCSRHKLAGRFAASGKAGPNAKRFSGKLGKKSLRPGHYRATLVARDGAGNRSKPSRFSFRVVR